MEILKVILLGIVQGITEFLPVSSSGHIVITEHFLDIKGDSVLLNIFMHFGTLIAIVAVYWRDILKVIREEWSTVLYIALATVPAVVAALFLEEKLERYFQNINYVGYFLILTGTILMLGSYADRKITSKKQLGWLSSIGIGFAQALALLPGISRSGSTISAGTMFGLDRDKAARFAFLMAIPVILGAVGKKSLDLVSAGNAGDFDITIVMGTVVSAVVGYISLRILLGIIHGGKFSRFSYYCFAAGICTIVYTLTR